MYLWLVISLIVGRRDKWPLVVPVSVTKCMLASGLPRYHSIIVPAHISSISLPLLPWTPSLQLTGFSPQLLILPLTCYSGYALGFVSLCFSFFLSPFLLYSCISALLLLSRAPGHVKSSFLTLCSGLFQIPLECFLSQIYNKKPYHKVVILSAYTRQPPCALNH